MINQNRTKKYLLYAIGEIILVVIGILIALQINNWNENRKVIASETTYLNALKSEFEQNQRKLESVIAINQRNLKYARALSEVMGKDSTAITKKELRKTINAVIGAEAQYRPNDGVINEILNSGKLELFKNDSLRFMLSSWDGELLKVRFQEQDEVHISRQHLFDIVFTKTNVKDMLYDYYDNTFSLTKSKLDSNEYDLLQSLALENALIRFIASSHYLDYRYRKMQDIQNDLLGKIDDL